MKHYEDLVARGCFSRVVLDSMSQYKDAEGDMEDRFFYGHWKI